MELYSEREKFSFLCGGTKEGNREKMTSLQRDPNRYCASVYMPIELGEKIMTEIEGDMVERKTRACIHGMKRRKIRTKREKTIGDFLVECAERRTKKTRNNKKKSTKLIIRRRNAK